MATETPVTEAIQAESSIESQRSPKEIANTTLSYFLSHHLNFDTMKWTVIASLFTNTENRFHEIPGDNGALTFENLEIPDQEAFAEFMLRVRTANYPELTTTTKTTASYSRFREEDITIIAPCLPGETLHRALRTHIVTDTKRFSKQLPRATTVTYFLRYPEEIPTE